MAEELETKLSKTLSYFLRHAPGEAGLEMDKFGFVDLAGLVEPLRQRKWPEITAEELAERLSERDQQRFELRGNRVRACYGHSVQVELDQQTISAPDKLYHGTSRQAWKRIRDEGLQPQNRQYVHLSTTRAEARRVGKRHDAKPVILLVEPPTAPSHEFYQVARDVVLTPCVPPEWLSRLESNDLD